jgi:F-type H+-transporting ATPase subunit delta
MPSSLAFRYARALAGAAPPAEVPAVIEGLAAFETMLAGSQALRHALQSPAVAPARKRAVISRMAEALSLSGVVRRFLLVLVDHRRAAWLGEILEAFEAVMDERQGLVRVDVVSARELSAAQRDGLVAELSRVTGRQARAQFSIREELIGGVLARVGSTVFDGSVRGQLETLKQRLAGAGT